MSTADPIADSPADALEPKRRPDARHARAIEWARAASLWTAAMLACFRLGDLRSSLTPQICGRWGCYPPLEAMLAVQAIWVLVLIPPLVWVRRRWPDRLRAIGVALLGVSLIGIAIIGWRQSPWAFETGPFAEGEYFGRRWGLSVLACTDAPLVAAWPVAAVCLWWGRPADDASSSSSGVSPMVFGTAFGLSCRA